jgi:hypothetical protein
LSHQKTFSRQRFCDAVALVGHLAAPLAPPASPDADADADTIALLPLVQRPQPGPGGAPCSLVRVCDGAVPAFALVVADSAEPGACAACGAAFPARMCAWEGAVSPACDLCVSRSVAALGLECACVSAHLTLRRFSCAHVCVGGCCLPRV